MMVKSFSPFRSGSKTALLLPLLGLLTIALGTERTDYYDPDRNRIETYSDTELHLDERRSKELGVPACASYTSSGELFTGTQKVYYAGNDSLFMENHYEGGIRTGIVDYRDGSINSFIWDWSQCKPDLREIYLNGILRYKVVPPDKREDGMGHIRLWHQNGQLSFEVSYTGDKEYQGLMTEYDQEGNITIQKRYEDGELVETIK